MAEIKSTNRNFIDLTGKEFGRLTVMEYHGRSGRGNSIWSCVCKCGGSIQAKTSSLTSGKTVSCGCKSRENLAAYHNHTQVVTADGRIIINGVIEIFVDPEDIGMVSPFNWSTITSKSGTTYAMRAIPNYILMHVLIMGGTGVDHKNGNGLDNRRSNLRFATQSQNCRNSKKPRTSGQNYKGVVPPSRRTRCWKIRLTVDGRQKEFGRYATEIEAAIAYDQKAKEVYGEFARLNFPEQS